MCLHLHRRPAPYQWGVATDGRGKMLPLRCLISWNFLLLCFCWSICLRFHKELNQIVQSEFPTKVIFFSQNFSNLLVHSHMIMPFFTTFHQWRQAVLFVFVILLPPKYQMSCSSFIFPFNWDSWRGGSGHWGERGRDVWARGRKRLNCFLSFHVLRAAIIRLCDHLVQFFLLPICPSFTATKCQLSILQRGSR